MQGHERRLHPRVRTHRKLALSLSDGSVVELWIHDLSLNGLSVHSAASADPGTRLNASLGLPDPATGHYVKVALQLKVVHVVFDGSVGLNRIGMQITAFHAGQETYQRYVNAELRQHPG